MPPSEKLREAFACKVCGAVPDEAGEIRHGRGCYVVSEGGGGSTYVELPEPAAGVPSDTTERIIYERWALIRPDGELATLGCRGVECVYEHIPPYSNDDPGCEWLRRENHCDSLRIAKVRLVEVIDE